MSSELAAGPFPGSPSSPCEGTPARAEFPPADPAEYRRACARFATGIAVVSVLDEAGQPHGMTVNSFTSVSLDPLLFLVSIDHRAGIFPLFHEGAPVGINILEESQPDLSARFARPGEDRFGAIEWTPGVTGAPLLKDVLATIEGTVSRMVVAGDHTLMLTEVHATSVRQEVTSGPEARPLIYYGSRYQRLGDPIE